MCVWRRAERGVFVAVRLGRSTAIVMNVKGGDATPARSCTCRSGRGYDKCALGRTAKASLDKVTTRHRRSTNKSRTTNPSISTTRASTTIYLIHEA